MNFSRSIYMLQKQVKQAPKNERHLLSAVINTGNALVVVIDRRGRIVHFNHTCEETTGYLFKEVKGKHIWDLFLTPKGVESAKDILYKLRAGHFLINSENHLLTKDGSRRLIAWSYIVFPNDEGIVGRIIASGIDITERKQAQEALREAEERYRVLVETSPDAITLFDLNLSIIMVNERILKLFGYERQKEVIGKSVLDYLVPEQLARAREDIGRVLESGSIEAVEYTLLKKNGMYFPAELRASLILDRKGKPSSILCVIRDITERKRAEEAVLEGEERFRDLFDNAPTGYFEYDIQGRITNVNRTELEMLGYTFEEMIGQPVWRFVVEEEMARKAVLAKVAGTMPPSRGLERTYRRKDGTTFPSLVQDRLRRNAEGKIVGIRGTVQDITERKRAEEEARRLAQENAVMAEIGRIIGSTLNIEETYEAFSTEVKKIISFDRIVIDMIDTEKNIFRNVFMGGEELAGRNINDVYPLEGSGNADMVRTKSTLLIQTEDFNEYKDRFPMLLSNFQAGFRSIMHVPLFSKGKVIGGLLLRSRKPYAYTDKDVRLAERIATQIAGAVANAELYAERIQAEQERVALQEQLRQSQKMEAIGRLAGGIAHDFNNLLTIIKGYAQLSCLELEEGGHLGENLEQIKKATERATDLIRHLLVFSRRQVMEMRVLDLNALLKNLDKMLRRIIGEDIELVNLFAEELGRVKADPGQIEQVIMNLAVNARDAMQNGGKLTIETVNVELDKEYARKHADVTPGHYVMLSVSDIGCGMTPEVKDRVFEPFFTTKEKGQGTGLGLSTVYGIVKQTGGNIWVYSEPGKGTTFKICFPRADEPLEEEKEKVVRGELFRGNETILIVEDDEEVRRLAARILQGQGYKVLEASQGVEAFLMSAEHKGSIHLMLTDVVMPGMSGRELANRLSSSHSEMKVLYMSGYTDNAITHHGVLEKGMNYIQKPFTIDGLASKVREVLDKSSPIR
jgi:two-component system cell cycle sensor histidine kinase/response regulator CckA